MDSFLLFAVSHRIAFAISLGVIFFVAMICVIRKRLLISGLLFSFGLVFMGWITSAQFIDAPDTWLSNLPQADVVVLRQTMAKRHSPISIWRFALKTQQFQSQQSRPYRR
ncbi:hypothetical protein [Acidithiobacillus ferrooxidans]|jgi:hypothetical protein|uniref:hypothetical protein n=1 Tax=Acidithiobacillus ferrooxidans TaxID=920 RepID=UPI0013CFA02B|nr:hypothetical protein [Acidithiobacillus ferrooxidans]